jgi:hypothetical protein
MEGFSFCLDTSLVVAFVSRDFQFYSKLRRIVPVLENQCTTNLFLFYAGTMASSGFGPYHGLWHDDAPTKCIGVIPTPWMMTRALGFVEILQV